MARSVSIIRGIRLPEPANELEFALDRPRRAAKRGRDVLGREPLDLPEGDGPEEAVAQAVEQVLAFLGDLVRPLRIGLPADDLCEHALIAGRRFWSVWRGG